MCVIRTKKHNRQLYGTSILVVKFKVIFSYLFLCFCFTLLTRCLCGITMCNDWTFISPTFLKNNVIQNIVNLFSDK